MSVEVHPLVSPWGRFGLYSFFLDAPEPAIVDTGVASSPSAGMAPALEKLGRRIEDVRWILLTHGHIDHIGGAHALWELTGRRAQVVIAEADAPLLRSRRAHVDLYAAVRRQYPHQPDGIERQTAMAAGAIAGELEPTVLVRGGETLSLGGGVTVSVRAVPGHTAGSVAYVVDGQDDVFVGDAVQVHGAANGFPGYEDPAAYRDSLRYLRDVVRPRHLYLGHPYRTAAGLPYGVELDAEQARQALQESLDVEARVAATAARHRPQETGSVYSPFAGVAEELGYTGDPALEPSPFFTTLHGYRTEVSAHPMTDTRVIEAGGQRIAVRKNLRVPMRDGVTLAVDAYAGVDEKPRPALVALSPYGKELQALALTMPPQRRPSPMWDGCIEAGDIARVVGEGYVHVIGDLRGSGASDGEHIGNYNAGGVPLGQDAYDVIEWVAEQPWCDGNVGMIGISYFGSMQIFAAAERPPHLKAIFVSGGHYDFYETTYHGGIMWFMPRAAREGRGGDSGWAFTDRVSSRMLETYSAEEVDKRVAERLQDPDVAAWPNLVHVLHYPAHHEAWFDIVLNELDGDWYEERNPINLARNIDIPVYLQINQGRGWTVDGHIELFDVLTGPKKLVIGPYPPMQSRPWVEEHDEMFRWYEYWLKGVDNGVMDSPAVSVFVEGSREVVAAEQWPPREVEYRSLYLRPRGRLSAEPEPMGPEQAAPDGFFQAPLTVTDRVEILGWSTTPFREDVELIGTGAAHLFAEIDQPDTNFILRLWDAAPDGSRQLITTGYLKASHRELDDARTTDGNPYHPHTRAVPVEPGTIQEYVLRLYPFAATFRPGHRLVAELSNDEPLTDAHNALLPPDAFHLPVGRPVTHTIYRDAGHPSRLVLPFTTSNPATL